MELSKDLDLNAWKRSTGAACYDNKGKTNNACMITAGGDTVCAPMTAGFFDGASAILGNVATKCVNSPAMAFIEPFDQTVQLHRK